VFNHIKDLQFEARPDGPDAAFAARLQEILGGRWGELTVAHQYLFQGWSCRLPGKYKDLLLDVGTEEMAHVEMICTMIARLLQDAPLSVREVAADDNPMIAAVYGGSNPAHFVQAGGGPLPMDGNGVPWTGAYVTSSGNLLADFYLNVTAEAQGRVQLARLFQMTDDPGVKQMLRFLLARDTAHQKIWLRAIEELKADGLDEVPVPEAFPDITPESRFAGLHLGFSAGGAEGDTWADDYDADPRPLAGPPVPAVGDPRLYTTPPSSYPD
jgi:Mn-containing catalase